MRQRKLKSRRNTRTAPSVWMSKLHRSREDADFAYRKAKIEAAIPDMGQRMLYLRSMAKALET